jgi:hypothetical protein
LDCQKASKKLKQTFVFILMLMRLTFNKTFVLDVDWSTKGVGAILSQKDGRMERIIAYTSKGLSFIHKRPCIGNKKFGKVHDQPMEGECYTLIWGIMHFRQFFYPNCLTLRIDRKPL